MPFNEDRLVAGFALGSSASSGMHSELLPAPFASLAFIVFLVAAVSVLLWSMYNLSIFMVGLRQYFSHRGGTDDFTPPKRIPFISLVVAAKDEAKLIGRLLESLLGLDYPKDKLEIIVVEDGSKDATGEICLRYASLHPSLIRYFHKPTSSGKPAALNFALPQVRGEIVGVLDADNIPGRHILKWMARSFEDQTVAAVQGVTQSINAQTNMLTRIISYEEAAYFKTLLSGKDHLRLFVPFTGSCQFIRSEMLRRVGGWSEGSLAEDVELSARLLDSGKRVSLCVGAISSQNAPFRLSQLFRQRTRWYRGYIETAIQYGRLIRSPSRSRVDAELSLLGPIFLSMGLVTYVLSWGIFSYPATLLGSFFAYLMIGVNTALLLGVGFALVYTVKPRKAFNLMWLPFVYAYWFLQAVIATYAVLLIALRRPRVWMKTEKT